MSEISELVGKLLAAGAAYRIDDAGVPGRLLLQLLHKP